MTTFYRGQVITSRLKSSLSTEKVRRKEDRAGHPVTSTNDDSTEQISFIILNDQRITQAHPDGCSNMNTVPISRHRITVGLVHLRFLMGPSIRHWSTGDRSGAYVACCSTVKLSFSKYRKTCGTIDNVHWKTNGLRWKMMSFLVFYSKFY